MTTFRSRTDRWLLGVDFAAFAASADAEEWKAKPSALKPMIQRLGTYGVKLNCAELNRQPVDERLAALKRASAAIDAGDSAPILELGWAAGELLDLPQVPRGFIATALPHLVAAARRFLQSLDGAGSEVGEELEEIAGWCRATLTGWASECEVSAYRELVLRAFESATAEPPSGGEPVSFRTASLEHVRSMIALRLICLLAEEEENDDVRFEGDLKKGTLSETDRSESSYLIGWDAAGVIAFGYHKYAFRERREPATAWLIGLPESLSPLAQRLVERPTAFTCGFWISADGRHLDRVGSDDDGSDLIERFTSEPESAMSKAWGPVGKSDRKLAFMLAQRAAAGGGRVGGEAGDDLFDLEPGVSPRRTRIAKELLRLGLKLRA